MALPVMTPVTSSNIEAHGHDGSALYVRFRGGRTYRYDDFPAAEYDAFQNADSHGKYFSENIRNSYTGMQV